MRLDRPVGTLLLLWPTLAALCGSWSPAVLVAAVDLYPRHFRDAQRGCVIGDYADRDGRPGKRTKQRPLIPAHPPRRLMAIHVAFAGVLVLFLRDTQLLAIGVWPRDPISIMKRWTHLPQVVLGAALGIPWSAQQTSVPSEAWLMFVASLLWIVAYDTEYAMVDRDDDVKIGVKSTAILFGDLDRLMIGILQAGAWLGFLLLGIELGYQHLYYVGLGLMTLLFSYQHSLIRHRQRDGCIEPLRSNKCVGVS